MVAGIFHRGSGLGNQLHRYVYTKILANKKGEGHTMIAPELFKAKDWMTLDIPPNDIRYTIEQHTGRVIPESMDGVIDGDFQAEECFIDHLDEIRGWLKYEPIPFNIMFSKPEEICILNLRGGEYVGHPAFLPREYWYQAIEIMKQQHPKMRFGVVTDDVVTAQKLFPNFDIRHDMHADWSAINTAHYLILSNSSFAILPALLNQNAKKIIAPKYWSGYNTGIWPKEGNKYKRFTYI